MYVYWFKLYIQYIYIYTIHFVVFLYKCIYVPYLQPATHRPMVYWNSGHHLFAGRGGETRIWNPAYANHSGILANTSVDVFLHSKFTIIYTYLFLYTYLCISFYFDQPGRKMMGFFVLVDWSWRKGLEFNYSFSYSFSTKILKYGYIYTCLRLHPNDW